MAAHAIQNATVHARNEAIIKKWGGTRWLADSACADPPHFEVYAQPVWSNIGIGCSVQAYFYHEMPFGGIFGGIN